jgi:hypothetical protein
VICEVTIVAMGESRCNHVPSFLTYICQTTETEHTESLRGHRARPYSKRHGKVGNQGNPGQKEGLKYYSLPALKVLHMHFNTASSRKGLGIIPLTSTTDVANSPTATQAGS